MAKKIALVVVIGGAVVICSDYLIRLALWQFLKRL